MTKKIKPGWYWIKPNGGKWQPMELFTKGIDATLYVHKAGEKWEYAGFCRGDVGHVQMNGFIIGKKIVVPKD